MKNEFLNESAEDIYVLEVGIVKVSKILEDGRKHNITYLKGPDMVTLFKNRVCTVIQIKFAFVLKVWMPFSIASQKCLLWIGQS